MRISDWSSDVCSSDLAVLADVSTQRIPVQRAAVVDFDIAATLFAQHCQGVLRQNAAIPQRTLEAGVGAAFGRQLAGSPIGVIAGGFHGTVGELDGGIGGEWTAHHVPAIRESLDTHANPPMAPVGITPLRPALPGCLAAECRDPTANP